jgi:hypothetical protein
MRNMPIGIQTFEDVITNDYVYVDKTAYVYKLATEGKVYFLGRPRRFGKSLFLSTLEAYFGGNRELFEGLALAELEQDWIAYPVLHIDLTGMNYLKSGDLDDALDAVLEPYEKEWGVTSKQKAASLRFDALIRQVAKKSEKKVVVLIDEYDKPLLESIDNEGLNNQYRNSLRAFYGVLKKTDQFLQFVLLTGVTKFSKVNVFSDLNQLRDISLLNAYSAICGITQAELEANFEPELRLLAEKNDQTYEEALANMKQHYDGYHFSFESEDIYNPFSTINVLANLHFDNYWYQTGTPTFLIKLMQQSNFDTLQFEKGVAVNENSLDDFRIGSPNAIPVLYQSGYLTIKGYDPKFREYTLGFPNDEVEYGFLGELLPAYFPDAPDANGLAAANFAKDLMTGDLDGFMTRLSAFFENIPYELNDKTERHYQVVFYLIFTLMGQFVQAEVRSAKGRADAVVTLDDAVYVFEFKLLRDGAGETAADAIKQIDDTGYLIPYTVSGKKLVKVGVQFDADARNIGEWKAETA